MQLEKLKARLAELQAANEGIVAKCEAENRDATEEENSTIDANLAEIDKAQASIERIERINAAARPAARQVRETAAPASARSTVPASVRVDPRTNGFRNLGEFAHAVRAAAMRDEGAIDRLRPQAALGVNEGVGEDGGFAVPPEFRDSIMQIVEGEDSLLSRTDSSTTSRNAVTQPTDETTPWGTAGIQVYWEGEGRAPARSKPALGQQTLRLNKLFALVDVTDEMLDDAPQMDAYLRRKAPEVMISVINNAIVRGNGVGKPLGILESPATIEVSKETSQPADTVHHRNIEAMYARMYGPSRRNAVWLVNQDIEPQLGLMAFRDVTTSPVPIYLPAGTVAGSPYGTLKGRPVIPVEACSELGDLGDIIFADLSKYRTIMKAGGMRTEVSIHLKFDTDEAVYRFIFRLAGAPWASKPITRQNSSQTLSHFITLQSR